VRLGIVASDALTASTACKGILSMANPAEPARPPQHPAHRPGLGFVVLVRVVFGDPSFQRRKFGGRHLLVDSLPTEKIVHDGWARDPFTPVVSIALPGPLVGRERRWEGRL